MLSVRALASGKSGCNHPSPVISISSQTEAFLHFRSTLGPHVRSPNDLTEPRTVLDPISDPDAVKRFLHNKPEREHSTRCHISGALDTLTTNLSHGSSSLLPLALAWLDVRDCSIRGYMGVCRLLGTQSVLLPFQNTFLILFISNRGLLKRLSGLLWRRFQKQADLSLYLPK